MAPKSFHSRLLCVFAVLDTAVAASSCGGIFGGIASAISGFPEAQSYCTSKYPVPVVTTTAPRITSTVTATTTSTVTAPVSSVTFTNTVATSTTTSTTATNTLTSTETVTESDTATSTTTVEIVTTTKNPNKKREQLDAHSAILSTTSTTSIPSTGTTKPATIVATTPVNATTPLTSSSSTTTKPGGPLGTLLALVNASAAKVCSCIESTTTITITPISTLTATAIVTTSTTPTVSATLSVTETSTVFTTAVTTVASTVTTTTVTTTIITATITATASGKILVATCSPVNGYCNNTSGCVCYQGNDGKGYCLINGGTFGAYCNRNADCPLGQACVDSRCSLPADEAQCGSAPARRLFAVRGGQSDTEHRPYITVPDTSGK